MPTRTAQARAGVRAMAALLPGMIPFGMITGFAGVQAGFTDLQAFASSVVVFAGAAQIALAQLAGADTPLIVVLGTVAAINLRFALYSAGLAPWLGGRPPSTRLLCGYLLTDQAYVVSVNHFAATRGTPSPHRAWFYLGGALITWVLWQLATLAGVVLGARLPESWELTFAMPLAFIAILVPTLRDRPSLAAAAVGGVVAVMAAPLPWNLGLVLAIVCGIAAGGIAARVGGRRRGGPEAAG